MSVLDDYKRKLDEIGGKLTQATDLVSQYQGAAYQIPEMIKKRVGEIYNNNADLIKQENVAQEQLTTTPTGYAAEMQSGRFAGNPILAGQAAAQREASIEKRLQDLRGMRKEREGTMADIISASTNAFGAQTAAVQGVADRYKNEYDLTNQSYNRAYQEEQDRLAAERQARQEAEDRRRYEEQKVLEERKFQESVRQFNATPHGSNGGSGSSMQKLLDSLNKDISTAINNSGKYVALESNNFLPSSNRESLIKSLSQKYSGKVDSKVIADLVYSNIRGYGEAEYTGLPDDWRL